MEKAQRYVRKKEDDSFTLTVASADEGTVESHTNTDLNIEDDMSLEMGRLKIITKSDQGSIMTMQGAEIDSQEQVGEDF